MGRFSQKSNQGLLLYLQDRDLSMRIWDANSTRANRALQRRSTASPPSWTLSWGRRYWKFYLAKNLLGILRTRVMSNRHSSPPNMRWPIYYVTCALNPLL